MPRVDISRNDIGWYIYDWDTGAWVSRVSDRCVTGEGAHSPEWEGYYSTKEEAEERARKHKQGISVEKVIHIGGE